MNGRTRAAAGGVARYCRRNDIGDNGVMRLMCISDLDSGETRVFRVNATILGSEVWKGTELESGSTDEMNTNALSACFCLSLGVINIHLEFILTHFVQFNYITGIKLNAVLPKIHIIFKKFQSSNNSCQHFMTIV